VSSGPPLEQAHDVWRSTQAAFIAFLDSVGAIDDAHTVTVRLLPQEIESAQQFADWLTPQVSSDGTWAFLTTTADDDGHKFGFAMPVARWRPEDALIFPFVEIHTLLIAWWLTIAWRARQLARAALALADAGDVIAAASCTRPLVETAAACWVDGAKLIAAWSDIKEAGTPVTDQDAFGRRSRMMKILNEVSWGAKFDERAPELKRLWNKVERSNVLGQVEKLAKVAGVELQEDYQWLCNTVHPSIGNTFAFSAPPFIHRTHTHVVTWFAGRPIHVEDGRTTVAEDTVERSTARGAARALAVLHASLDAALNAIDDVALTTGAAKLARESYWRMVVPAERNDLCPCRSGRKAKHCRHDWGDAAPTFPARFD
jgi:hypothetical protein